MKILNSIGLDLYPYGTEQLTLIPFESSLILTVIEDKIYENRIYSVEFYLKILANFLRSS